MLLEDTAMLLARIKATYPNWKPEVSNETLLAAWHDILQDVSAGEAYAALKAYICSNTSGFAPSPGQLIQIIHKKDEQDELTPEEAWALVYRAICNSGYSSAEEFEKLPPECRRAIGRPETLKELCMMDAETVNSVEKSHFIRQYRMEIQKKRELERIPPAIRERLGILIAAKSPIQAFSSEDREIPVRDGKTAGRGKNADKSGIKTGTGISKGDIDRKMRMLRRKLGAE